MVKYGNEIRFFLVDIKNITPKTERSQFAKCTLDYIADMILETGCLVQPLLLKKIRMNENGEQYEILRGEQEYHAAMIAYERDTERRLGGMVSAFVVSGKTADAACQQATALGNAW